VLLHLLGELYVIVAFSLIPNEENAYRFFISFAFCHAQHCRKFEITEFDQQPPKDEI
jgi:hypothetical protein